MANQDGYLDRFYSLVQTRYQGILFVAGLITVVVGVMASGSSTGFCSLILTSIGTSLVTAGIVSATWKRMGQSTEREQLTRDISNAVVKAVTRTPFNSAGIVATEIAKLTQVEVPALLRNARTVRMAFLYEDAWSAVYTAEIEEFLRRDSRNRLIVYLPGSDGDLTAMAGRHKLTAKRFKSLVDERRRHFKTRFSGIASEGQIVIRSIPRPGPAYTCYLFDPDTYVGSEAETVHRRGDPNLRSALVRVYRQRMDTSEALLTITVGPGQYWEQLRQDFTRWDGPWLPVNEAT